MKKNKILFKAMMSPVPFEMTESAAIEIFF